MFKRSVICSLSFKYAAKLSFLRVSFAFNENCLNIFINASKSVSFPPVNSAWYDFSGSEREPEAKNAPRIYAFLQHAPATTSAGIFFL